MKKDFNTYQEQMIRINHFISRNTNLKKICQYCGKPAQVRHNKENPYLINFICVDCKTKYNLNKKENRDILAPNIPAIDVRDYITNPRVLNRLILFDNDELKEKIQFILNSNFSKTDAIRYLNTYESKFDRIIDKYAKEVDPKIHNKLKKVFKKNRRNQILNNRLIKYYSKDNPNNIIKLKLEKNISNLDIDRLSNHGINKISLSNITTGKVKPKMRTKCLLAKVFKVSVSEIFPEDIFLTNIYNWKDYYILNEKLRNNLITIINKRKSTGERQVIKHLSEEIGITVNKIYRFTNNRIILEDSKDLESISNFIKNNK